MQDETSGDDPQQPIRTLAYRLTPADAVAFEALPRPLTGLARLVVIVWLALAGVILALLPENVVGRDHSLRWWLVGLALLAIQFALLVVVHNLLVRRRARKRVPAAGDVELEEWGDHLREKRDGSDVFISPETIARVIRTGRHVFIDAPDDVLIIPAAAFETANDMAAFADGWDGASRDPAEHLYGARAGENR